MPCSFLSKRHIQLSISFLERKSTLSLHSLFSAWATFSWSLEIMNLMDSKMLGMLCLLFIQEWELRFFHLKNFSI